MESLAICRQMKLRKNRLKTRGFGVRIFVWKLANLLSIRTAVPEAIYSDVWAAVPVSRGF